MPKFNVDVPHSLTADDARARLGRFADALADKFKDKISELEQHWEGDALAFRLKTYGIPLEGRITVDENRLHLAGDLPFSAVMFKGKIENSIRDELTKLMQD
jgi:putative polyhydroxyalkanoate system protein